jgi:hypothetical protein
VQLIEDVCTDREHSEFSEILVFYKEKTAHNQAAAPSPAANKVKSDIRE